MIYHDTLIREWANGGGITPFDPTCVNPASIDLKLGNTIRTPRWYWKPVLWRLARRLALPRWTEPREFDTYLLKPGEFVLCSSVEITRIPDDTTAFLFLKSSAGRQGIEHLHAGCGDPGFSGQWTWELQNAGPWPVELVAGKRLMQLVLMKLVAAPERSYAKVGRYQNQRGPMPRLAQRK